MKNDIPQRQELGRRRALGLIAGASAALAFGCGESAGSGEAANDDAGTGGEEGADTSDGATSDVATGIDGSSTGDAGACEVTPEGEIGPYFSDDSDARFNRSNILSNLDGTSTQEGVGLTLTVTVVDTENGCAPYVNAQVDIWHCNAAGVYSDQSSENTNADTWLRGYQLTDANGQVTFVTILPGWYAGRTNHIHVRIRSTYSEASSTSDGTNTTQLFFTQAVDDTLSTSVAPYSAEGTNPTTNASDHVYSGETDGANVLSLSGDDVAGYTASITIALPITST